MLENLTKRGLSALLVLVMVLTMVPFSAFATEDGQAALTEEVVYPNTPDDGHEHHKVETEEVEALCEDPGMTAGSYCDLCGKTLSGRVVIPARGHSITQFEAKMPTFNTVGWEAYEDCGRCGYSTYVEIPKLETPAIEDFETFIMYLSLLEELADIYVTEYPGNDPLDLVIKYIRTGVDRYNSGSWGIMAGYEDAGFAKFVAEMEDMVNAEATSVDEMLSMGSLKNLKNFTLPNGETADIGHMFGTMDITYHNSFGENHADVGGWAGDLVDLLEFSDYMGISGTLDEMIAQINEKTFLITSPDEVGGFNNLDMIGDMDALYLMDTIEKNGYSFEYETSGLFMLMMEYFTEDLSMEDRAAYFLQNRMNGITVRGDLRDAVYSAYTTNKVITTLEGTREFNSQDLTTLRKAVCYAFADYMCKLAGDYVESGENNLYTVFSSESANLAPGIDQQIKMATNASGQQLVYYLATADITREDVNLYANYHNNDPTQGWEMQRVMDQALAAEERHSDPGSELYIENYNVIAAVNGSGFNMSTGEPSGVLVMEGVEYQSISSAGFVGILKDGSPVIGTKEEYETVYKGQVKEAIAIFGARLIEDGKIVAGLDDTPAPRTAIGFTKTGKVVLLVVDGRQGGSAGAGYATLAQILLEAGCVDAVNLDGGGSTTFVAQQPGDEDLSVVNSPSDGYARSVSTSWILVSTAPSSTAFDHAVIESDYDYLTVGTALQLDAVGISPTGNTVDIPEGAYWAVSNERWATVTEDGQFTALRNGTVDVYLMLGEDVIGSKTMNIVEPDNIRFTKENVDTVFGATKELPVKVYYQGKEIAFIPADIVFTLSNAKAGTMEGLSFVATANANVGLTNVTVTASLANGAYASIKVSLYKQGELTFDFEQATGGDRQLAWVRDVSNAVEDANSVYTVVDAGQDMVTSYILAIDMTQIPIPARLEELTYMLPGADVAGANAWTFLCQLAQRISVLSEIKAVVNYDPNFTLDISQMKLINDYFTLTSAEVDEENSTLTLTLKWKKQAQAINPESANPMCIVNGLVLTPKADAQWDSKNQLKVINTGNISYKIYMKASALHGFASKPENQEAFGLYSYINPDDTSDKGGYFQDTYKQFYDSYTLVNQLKEGWYTENGGFSYYVAGEKLTGVQQIEGLYYELGADGIAKTQTPYSGLLTQDGNTYYAKLGELVTGWQTFGGDWYLFDWMDSIGKEGTHSFTIAGVTVTYEFEGGKVVKGFWHQDDTGLQYFYGPYYHERGWKDIDGRQYFFDEGYAATGIYPVRASHDVHPIWCEFEETGALIGDAPDGAHWFDGKLYYVIGTSSNHKGLLFADGNYYYAQWDGSLYVGDTYWITNTYDMLEAGFYRFGADGKIIMTTELVEEDDGLYYYKDGMRAAGTGLIEIDGDYYYIDGAARAAQNETIWVSRTNGLWPAGYYTFGADGKMVILTGIVGDCYYVDGIGTAAGLIFVDGDYYYADWGGKLIAGKSYWISNTNDLLAKGYYRFDADGKIIMTTEVVDENGTLYYYQDGLRTAGAGLVEVGGDYYHIDKGAMAERNVTIWVSKTNGYFPAGEYTFGADGKMVIYNGIVDGRYYVDGVGTAAGLILIDGSYYYAQWGGNLAMDQTCWVSKTNGFFPEGEYTFDAEGKMVIYNGIVDGRYYVDGVGTDAGLILVDGDYYFAQWSGYLITDQLYWISNTNGLLPKGYYRFGADGKILMTTEVVDEDGTLYYYENGIRTSGAGLVLFNGDYYHIGNGAIADTGKTLWVSKTNGHFPAGEYTFGEDGKMLIYNGIVDGCYYVDGVGTAAGLILVDGSYYFAGWGGKLITNQSYWVEKTNGLFPVGTYTFDAEGKMAIYNGVVDGRYFVNGVGTDAGLVLFDGSYYYAQWGGYLVSSQTFWISKTNGLLAQGYYRFGADGKILMTTEVVNENGTRYYYQDGIRTPGAGLVACDGAYYHIGSNAIADTNKTFWVSKTNGYFPAGEYTFGEDGKMFVYNGIVNGVYYVDAVGTAAGLIFVDGDYYYADWGGKLVTGKSYWISKTNDLLEKGYYRFAADGKIIMTTEVVNENGTLYYYQDGIRTTGAGLVLFNGDYYHIGNGAIADTGKTLWVSKPNGYFPVGEYTFGEDGKMLIYNGIVNGRYYVDGIGTAAGLILVDGEYYFADYGGKLITNKIYWVEKTNGLLPAGDYTFGADGKLVRYNGIVNGCYYVDGVGTAAGLIFVDGDYYYADWGGKLVTGKSYWISKTNDLLEKGYYRFAADGKILMTTEVVNEDGTLYYYENGIRTSGVGLVLFNGDYYHIGNGAIADTGKTLWVSKTNGYFPVGEYTFGEDGKMLIYNGIVDGCYYVDGIGTAAGLILVDGDYYFADYGGKLITNKVYWVNKTNGLLPVGEYTFGADGKMARYNGIVNGCYYVDGVGTAAGLIFVDGDYYFAGYGGKLIVSKEYWVEDPNGQLPAGMYTFGADGKMIL